MKALQQRVVELARDAGALSDTPLERHLEFMLHAAYVGPVCRPEQRHNRGRAYSEKPSGPVEGRKYRDADRRPGGVPDAIAVGGDEVERISARRQVGIVSGPTRADVDPVRLEAFEPVFEPYLRRVDEADAGVGDFQIVLMRLQHDLGSALTHR